MGDPALDKPDQGRMKSLITLRILAPIGFCLRERTRDLGRTCLGGSASLQSHSNLISLCLRYKAQAATSYLFAAQPLNLHLHTLDIN